MSVFRETAYAKLNLALHVRGRLPDGRHAIETIFAFCEDGDELTVQSADDFSLRILGPFAAGLTTAEGDVAPRIKLKLETGLNPANAAP